MIADVQKHDLFFFLAEKLKKDSVPLVDGETPLFLELAVEPMRIKTRVELVASENRNALIGEPLQLRIQIFVAAAIPRVDVNRHAAGVFRRALPIYRPDGAFSLRATTAARLVQSQVRLRAQ